MRRFGRLLFLLHHLAAEEIGPVGAGFTFVCLVSGSLWGKPMWGAYWVWDARLTSVLVPKCLKAVETRDICA